MMIRFDMIEVFVGDLGKMVAFYRDTLGLKTDWDGKVPHVEFRHEGIRFSMFARAELPGLLGQTPTYPEGLNGTFQLTIDYQGNEIVDKEYARVVQSGAQPVYAPREEPWGMYSSMVADPEGNLIELGSWRKGPPPPCRLGVATVSVSSLSRARQFYEGLLGFRPGGLYEPTHWLPLMVAGKTMFAIEEVDGFARPPSEDTLDFLSG